MALTAPLIENAQSLCRHHVDLNLAGQHLRIAADDESVADHFRCRLGCHVAQRSSREVVGQVAALTSPENALACGLMDAPEHEDLDREMVFRVPSTNCVAAISLPRRAVALAALAPNVDRYWFVDYLAEIIPGLLLGDEVVTLHAAAVAMPQGAVALVGEPASGKTTLAACLAQTAAGCFLADDKLLLARDAHAMVHAHSLYMDLHFDQRTIELVPGLAERAVMTRRGQDITGNLRTRDEQEANEYRMAITELWPDWKPITAPMKAVVFPRLVPGRAVSRLAPLSPSRSWSLLAAHVLPFLGDHWPSIIERDRRVLRSLVSQCRCYRLYLGSDVAEAANRILEIAQ